MPCTGSTPPSPPSLCQGKTFPRHVPAPVKIHLSSPLITGSCKRGQRAPHGALAPSSTSQLWFNYEHNFHQQGFHALPWIMNLCPWMFCPEVPEGRDPSCSLAHSSSAQHFQHCLATMLLSARSHWRCISLDDGASAESGCSLCHCVSPTAQLAPISLVSCCSSNKRG